MVKITNILDQMLEEFQDSNNTEFIMSEGNAIKLAQELGVEDSIAVDYKGFQVTIMEGCDEFKIYIR